MLLTDLSDHFGTFIAVAEKKCHVDKPKVVQIRDMSNFDLELFLQELKQHLRDAELQKTILSMNNLTNFVLLLIPL